MVKDSRRFFTHFTFFKRHELSFPDVIYQSSDILSRLPQRGLARLGIVYKASDVWYVGRLLVLRRLPTSVFSRLFYDVLAEVVVQLGAV